MERVTAPNHRLTRYTAGQSERRSLRRARARFNSAREIIRLVGQDFQIARRAAAIAHIGKIRRALRRGRQQFLVLAKLAVFRVGNQRVRNLAERVWMVC